MFATDYVICSGFHTGEWAPLGAQSHCKGGADESETKLNEYDLCRVNKQQFAVAMMLYFCKIQLDYFFLSVAIVNG